MRQWRGSLKLSAESAHGDDTFMFRHESKDKMDVACSTHRKHDECVQGARCKTRRDGSI